MAKKQIEISFRELDKIYITCACGAGVIAGTSKKIGGQITSQERGGCPGCTKGYTLAGQAVYHLREFFTKAQEAEAVPKPTPGDEEQSEAKTEITFRIRLGSRD